MIALVAGNRTCGSGLSARGIYARRPGCTTNFLGHAVYLRLVRYLRSRFRHLLRFDEVQSGSTI